MAKKPFPILSRILGKLRRPEKPPAARIRKRPEHRSALEPLERRIAPASVLSPTSLIYTDLQGDKVTVKFSQPILSLANTTVANTIFQFDTGVVDQTTTVRQQLETMDLTGVNFKAGLTISVTAVKAGGNGLVDVGYIDAATPFTAAHSISSISVSGDLGRLDVGTIDSLSGLGKLSVGSMGAQQLVTQAPGGSLSSHLFGALGSLTIVGNLDGVDLHVLDSVTNQALQSPGKIGAVTIGGLIKGETLSNSGSITTDSDISAIKIAGGIAGGSGMFTGSITSGGKIASLTVSASIAGGSGDFSGSVSSALGMGAVNIAGGLIGNATSGVDSGSVLAGGAIVSVTVKQGLTGGAGDNSGSVFSGFDPSQLNSNIGAVKITGEVIGGAGNNSGLISSGGSIASASFSASLTGGAGDNSGSIFSVGAMGAVTVAHNVTGGAGANSGNINSGLGVGNVTIGGSLTGAGGEQSGAIVTNSFSTPDADFQGNAGIVKITGGIVGGGGENSGQISIAGSVTSITAGGALTGGTANGSGSIFAGTDYFTSGAIGALTIHDIQGGSILSGTNSLDSTGYVSAQRIGAITVAGSITAGINNSTGGELTHNASIQVEDDLGALVVKGNISGSTGTGGNTRVVISAMGQAVPGKTTDVAIASLTVGGNVAAADILAGYDIALLPADGHAQIGAVSVKGNWTASNLIAGVQDVNGDGFGNADDARIPVSDASGILSKIASIVISGTVAGDGHGDPFGFEAEAIASVKIGGATVVLAAPGAGSAVSLGDGVTIRQVSTV